MGRRDLLADDERRAISGVPDEHEALVRLYTLRHPGFGFMIKDAPSQLVAFLAVQIDVPASAFVDYGARGQTASDHARALMEALGVRPSAKADFLPMIEATAIAAWSTDRGVPIASGIVDALGHSTARHSFRR